ncbi:MAG: hypothetical protein ACI9UN_004063 [Granulosicoccus sp.]
MKYINLLLIIATLPVLSSAQASLIPLGLLDGSLNEQSVYANFGVTLGDNTKVGGNMQGASPITIGVDSVVGGNIEARTAVTTGAGSSVGGYIQAGTTVKTGVGSVVEGDVFSGTTTGTGGTSMVNGKIEAGGSYTGGINATVNGTITDMLSSNPLYVPPVVENQDAQLAAAQQTLKLLGVGSSTALASTFGTVDETLTAGIYDSLDYLTIRAGKTLTLDGEGVDGVFLFNIHNYLDFAAAATVELINFTDDSKIIWNVLGDKTGSAGYFQTAAGAKVRGFVFASGYVDTGADTTILGVGNSCGGAVSREDYVGFGARNTIGAEGCVGTFVDTTLVSEPQSVLLFGFGLSFGLMGLVLAKRKPIYLDY